MYLPSVVNLFDDMFEDFDQDFFGLGPKLKLPKLNLPALMRTDVTETKDHYQLKIELPGFKKDDISVKLDDGFLTVAAQTAHEANEKTDAKGKTRKNGRFIRKERYEGSMHRSWFVGKEIKKADIKASYQDGVLSLAMPKAKPAKALPEDEKYIAIEG